MSAQEALHFMPKRLSIKEFSEAIGLSVGTVSRAFNDHPSVHEATRENVLRKARELGYEPNRAARTLATGRTWNVSLWFPLVSDSYTVTVIEHLEDVALSDGYELMVSDLRPGAFDNERLIRLLRWSTDGVLVEGGHDWLSGFLERVGPVHKPIVSMGHECCPDTDHVGIALSKGTETAVVHLHAQGCRRIAYLCPADYEAELRLKSSRYEGYLSGTTRCGLEPEFITFSRNIGSIVRSALLEHIRRHGCPEGIFCYNDACALTAIQALRETGNSVPRHVRVVGCDDIEEASLNAPSLSTLRTPLAEMCRVSWHFLRNRMKNPDMPLQRHMVEPELVVRASSVAVSAPAG
jgi:LacI family transcriptional regulator